MMRNLIVLGCAGLLALGLSMSSFAGVEPDTDLDGVSDSNDNCVSIPNGPLGGLCNNNQDGSNVQNPNDPDGYGVTCDFDYNNNGAADSADLGVGVTAFLGGGSDIHTDHNCNGAADSSDLGALVTAFLGGAAPGPSGKACAGTVPCP